MNPFIETGFSLPFREEHPNAPAQPSCAFARQERRLPEARCLDLLSMFDHETIFCPFCGTANTVAADGTPGLQRLIVDCENCCRPMAVTIECDESGQVLGAYAEPA